MLCKKCGNDEFEAHQRVYMDVIVDQYGEFIANAGEDDSPSIYEHERPYGPFTCTKCGEEYDELV